MSVNVMDTLRARGFVKQTVYEEELYEKLGKESVPFYIGFDPTADSLHVGHFMQLIAMHTCSRQGISPSSSSAAVRRWSATLREERICAR